MEDLLIQGATSILKVDIVYLDNLTGDLFIQEHSFPPILRRPRPHLMTGWANCELIL